MGRVISRRQLLMGTTGTLGVAIVGCGGSGAGSGSGTDSRVVWQQDPPVYGGIVSLAVSGGTLYAGSKGSLYALDAAGGKQRWEYDGDAGLFLQYEPAEQIPPVCDADTVYALSSPSQGPGAIHAVDAATGRRRWVYTSAEGPATVPVTGGGGVFTGTGDSDRGTLVALDPATGKPRWTVPTAQSCGRPGFAAGVVYAGDSTGNAYALDASSGKQLWQVICAETDTTRLPDLTTNRPVAANGLVYFVLDTPDDLQPMIYALHADTGQPAWTVPAPKRKTSVADSYQGPFLVGSTLCVANNSTGDVYGVDASTGARRWQSIGNSSNDGTSCVAGSALLTGCRRGGLSALDSATGRLRWQLPGSGSVAAGPVVAGGLAYVGTESDGPPVDKLAALRV